MARVNCKRREIGDLDCRKTADNENKPVSGTKQRRRNRVYKKELVLSTMKKKWYAMIRYDPFHARVQKRNETGLS
jgi:hypothetical protein